MTEVLPPIPYFSDRDGEALENGQVYIGVEGMNARSNPIAVYWDEDLTIPASQPLRTLAGFPAYQGAPRAFHTAATAYSLTVLDRNGVPVYTDRDGQVFATIADLDQITENFSEPSRVLEGATWLPIQNSTDIRFSAGVYTVWNGTADVLVNGSSTPQQLSFTGSGAVLVDANGDFSTASTFSETDTPVAFFSNGQLIDVIGAGDRSSRGADGGTLNAPPWWPLAMQRLQRMTDDGLDVSGFDVISTVNGAGALTFSTNFDVASLKPTPAIEYWVNKSGSDATGDGSEGNPFATGLFAYNFVPLCDGIVFDGGGGAVFGRTDGWTFTVDRDMMVRGVDGATLTAVDQGLSWSAVGDGSYTATLATPSQAVVGVIDYANPDAARGNCPERLEEVGDPGDVVPSTWNQDGATIKIETFDSRAPDSDIRVVRSYLNGKVTATGATTLNVYVEDLIFEDGAAGMQVTTEDTGKVNIVYDSCHFGITMLANSNACNCFAYANLLYQGCTFEFGFLDNLNEHAQNGDLSRAPCSIAINCISHDCGFNDLNFNNAFTSHDDGFALRLNCEGYRTQGRSFHDVTGAITINIGCYGHDTVSATPDDTAHFTAGQGIEGDCVQYLIACRSSGAGKSITTEIGAVTYLFNTPTGERPEYRFTNPHRFMQAPL